MKVFKLPEDLRNVVINILVTATMKEMTFSTMNNLINALSNLEIIDDLKNKEKK